MLVDPFCHQVSPVNKKIFPVRLLAFGSSVLPFLLPETNHVQWIYKCWKNIPDYSGGTATDLHRVPLTGHGYLSSKGLKNKR